MYSHNSLSETQKIMARGFTGNPFVGRVVGATGYNGDFLVNKPAF
jgi:hypothetical protein